MNSSQGGVLRAIAVFKLLKAAALIVTGLGVLKLVHKDVGAELEHLVVMAGFDPGGRFVGRAIQRVTDIPPHRIRELGIVSFVYAALFMTEGVGLWMLKRWAEWFTVIITSSLLPVEVWEIYRHPSLIKVLVLMVNLGVVGYLIYRIRQEGRGS
jgi:uncharacterized membrane protein (DUF2068 family)